MSVARKDTYITGEVMSLSPELISLLSVQMCPSTVPCSVRAPSLQAVYTLPGTRKPDIEQVLPRDTKLC